MICRVGGLLEALEWMGVFLGSVANRFVSFYKPRWRGMESEMGGQGRDARHRRGRERRKAGCMGGKRKENGIVGNMVDRHLEREFLGFGGVVLG